MIAAQTQFLGSSGSSLCMQQYYGIPSSMHKQTTEVTASPVSRMYGATWYLYVLRYYLLLQAYGKLRMGDGGHV